MILNEVYRLTNGVEIPKLGLGTWEIEDSKAAQVIREAIKIGYRHIDTAQGYGNERGVGEGIRNCGISRDKLFVTSKIEADIKNYEDAVASIQQTLEKMELDYIDLMIIHSPQPWKEFRGENHYFEENLEVWHALEEAYEVGKVRSIGVSNFNQVDIDNLIRKSRVKPMVNQILIHISNTPLDLIDYCQNNKILVEAYSPIAHGEILNQSNIVSLSQKYNVTVPQLCIRYCLQLGCLPIPKSSNPTHILSNSKIDFEISSQDMEVLRNIDQIKDYGKASAFPVYSQK